MICPHCGNQTTNAAICDHCGSSTEFAERTNYLSVGNHSNGTKLLPDYTLEKETRSSLLRWLTGAVVLFLLLCLVEAVALLLALGSLERSSNQIESIEIEQNTQVTATTVPIQEIHQNETEDVSDATNIRDNDIQNPPFTDTEEGGAKIDNIQILFDVNATVHMKLFGCIPTTPQPITLGQQAPPLSIDPDDDRYAWSFTGWNTKPDGTGIAVPVGLVIDLPLSESITLYAQWEEHEPNKSSEE